MAMSRFFKTIIFLLLFSLLSNANNDLIFFSEKEFTANFKTETKKLYRKYVRLLKSSEIKLQTSKKINITFRHLHSNYHFSDELYYNFFQFILNLKDNKSFEDEVEKILDFVNSSYPSISEKKL